MAWRITRDLLHEQDVKDGREPLVGSRVGTESAGAAFTEKAKTYALYDDDGELYYVGEIDQAGLDADDDEPGSLYGALQYGAHDAGAVALYLVQGDEWPYGRPSSEPGAPGNDEPLQDFERFEQCLTGAQEAWLRMAGFDSPPRPGSTPDRKDGSMTRKDFELIAQTLRNSVIDQTSSAANEVRDLIAYAFADALAATNPRFDRARFLAACGVEA